MKCYICDKTLTNDEIKFEPAYGRGNFAPCGVCMEIIDEIFEPLDEEEIDNQLADEFFLSMGASFEELEEYEESS